jgi:PadR family transcriptional regulator, regulatory protein PadR
MMSAPTELLKGYGYLLILSCLNRMPMHGYRITKEIGHISKGYFPMNESTVYIHLHALEKDGLVEGSWEAVSVAKQRKCYRITDSGRADYARRSCEAAEVQRRIIHFLEPTREDT